MSKEWDADAEWRKAQEEIARGGSSVPREPSGEARAVAGSGPRDWRPPEIDEPETFDRDVLERPSERFSPTSVALFVVAAVAFVVAFLGLFGVIGGEIAGTAGAAGFVALVAAIWFSLPAHRDFDDDGARV
ncbi:hypothetical protein J2S49_000252 [Arcanobacterium wilhelmae]|uniref:Uncharacterized protein n=1 Tax=Arcanobacterium wilhelmae TaxID=1803177 RepID=A0ABT9N9U1_9ACTO|nr:hypothetical protein [Arcanobacterium wilhelmae]MDP9800176.1 hypothetical protein [Arcanobacterium wilhelmae]WFN89617.1 hypothetical protein P8A24_05255 [Arcanobacterium wilhelmae]